MLSMHLFFAACMRLKKIMPEKSVLNCGRCTVRAVTSEFSGSRLSIRANQAETVSQPVNLPDPRHTSSIGLLVYPHISSVAKGFKMRSISLPLASRRSHSGSVIPEEYHPPSNPLLFHPYIFIFFLLLLFFMQYCIRFPYFEFPVKLCFCICICI